MTGFSVALGVVVIALGTGYALALFLAAIVFIWPGLIIAARNAAHRRWAERRS